jgi:cell division protein FtsQ
MMRDGMKRSFRAGFLIRKNRLKCHSGKVCHDCFKAAALLAVILVMTAALIYSYNYAISSPYFRIKGIVVRGCRELTEKDVLTLAAIKPSQTIFSVNIKALARRISSNPWVRKVAVGREFPNGLQVEIEERIALAMCKRGDDFYLLDTEGVPFKKLDNGDEVDVPVLTGYYREDGLNKDLLNKTICLLKKLALSKSFPTVNMVSEINGSTVSGLSLYTDNGFCLKLGFDNYDSKLQRLLAVLAALDKRNIKNGFLNIDLRDVSKIYVERRPILEPAEHKVMKKRLST